MKKMMKKFFVVSILASFVFTGLFCCCIEDVVQAKEELPPCHQTSSTDDSHDSTDCECDLTMAVLQNNVKSDQHVLAQSVFIPQNIELTKLSVVADIEAYQAPPLIYNSTPLYIKHSILRI